MLRILKISLLVSVVVLLNAMTTLLFVQNAVPASAGPQCVDGDVNGDAVVDITDPIYLLSYMFGGGPEPVACAQNPVGVTPEDLALANSYYFSNHDDAIYLGVDVPPQTQNLEVFIVPPERVLVLYPTSLLPGFLVNGSFDNLSGTNRSFFPGDVLSFSNTGTGWSAVRLRGHLGNFDPDPSNELVQYLDKTHVRHSDWVWINNNSFTVPDDRSFMLTDIFTCCIDDSYLQLYVNGSSIPVSYDGGNDARDLNILLSPGDVLEGSDTLGSANANWDFGGYWVR